MLLFRLCFRFFFGNANQNRKAIPVPEKLNYFVLKVVLGINLLIRQFVKNEVKFFINKLKSFCELPYLLQLSLNYFNVYFNPLNFYRNKKI